jgi:hypothetical protein
VRWFDGSQWTEHAAPVGAAPGFGYGYGDLYDGAKGESTARLAVVAFIVRGFVTGFQAVASGVLLAGVWDQMMSSLDDPERANEVGYGGAPVLSAVSQLMSLLGLATLVFLCIWTFRATKNARALGLRTAVSPGWSVAGWIIPFANFVMPYLSVRDLFPLGHAGRRQAGIWWSCEITGVVLSIATSIVAFSTSTGPAVVVGVFAAASLVAAGLLGAQVCRAASAVHTAIASGHAPV